MRSRTFAALLLSTCTGLASADEITCRRSGAITRCDDGSWYRQHGDRITDDEGRVWRRRDNGDVVDPNGEVWRRRGHRWIGPDGETCRMSGRTIRCSD
jgi:hypothetical protein